MTPHDKLIAFIRTYVPYSLGALFAWLLVRFALEVPEQLQLAIIAFAVVVAQNAYYFLIRLLERYAPWLGIFLGFPKQPEYTGISDLWASVIRTGIPTLAGALVFLAGTWVASLLGFHLDESNIANVTVIAIGILQALYYALAKALTDRWPAAGWLLGGIEAPRAYTS